MKFLRKNVIACYNASGEADFAFVKTYLTEEEYIRGDHYEIVTKWCKEQGYEDPMVVFDYNELPAWLGKVFVWKSASIIGSNI